MNKKTFNAKYNINYSRLFSMVSDIGPDLNSRKNRFDKSDLLEQAIDVFSDSRLAWVDDIGFDHQDIDDNKFEVKSQKFCLFTPSGNLKSKTASLKLTNTLQDSSDKSLNVTADYLLIIDTGSEKSFSMAIIPYEDVVKNHSKQLSDGFSCQIPMDKVVIVANPNDILIREVCNIPRYSDEKKKLQREYICRFKEAA